MQVLVNGKTCDLPEGATVTDLIAQLDLQGRRIAIEVNEAIVPKSLHPQTPLRSGDRVEIVHAIGGG